MGLGALGSVMMMFGQNERAMRYGMMLTTTAMALQMYQTYQSINATMRKAKANMAAKATEDGMTVSAARTTGALAAQTTATNRATIAINGLKVSIQRLMAATAALAVVAVVFEGLSRVLFKANTDLANTQDAYATGVADTALVMQYLTHSETELLGIIKDKEKAYNVAIQQNTTLGKETATRLSNEIASAQKAYDMQVVANMEQAETIDLAKEYYKILKDQEDVMKNQKGILDDIQRGLVSLYNKLPSSMRGNKSVTDFLTGGRVSDQEKFNKQMEEFKETNIELYTFLKGLGVSTWEEADDAILQYQETVKKQGEADADLYSNMVSNLGDAEDAIYSFNNAREELFFGFSSDRLTGDLVRQVRQQGVETLITSTEVIMTNNFNGMTTAEVASEILRLIETEGNFKGYNFATTAG